MTKTTTSQTINVLNREEATMATLKTWTPFRTKTSPLFPDIRDYSKATTANDRNREETTMVNHEVKTWTPYTAPKAVPTWYRDGREAYASMSLKEKLALAASRKGVKR